MNVLGSCRKQKKIEQKTLLRFTSHQKHERSWKKKVKKLTSQIERLQFEIKVETSRVKVNLWLKQNSRYSAIVEEPFEIMTHSSAPIKKPKSDFQIRKVQYLVRQHHQVVKQILYLQQTKEESHDCSSSSSSSVNQTENPETVAYNSIAISKATSEDITA